MNPAYGSRAYGGGSRQPYFPHPQKSRSDVQNLMEFKRGPFKPTVVILLRDCFMRFQKPRRDQSPESARVTTLVWEQTSEAVTRTINNFYATDTNAQLWLKGDISGLLYAGLYTSRDIPTV